ncbi:hypothetical protein [Xylophilus sp. GOD-11R]|uniref:hypothetical protein n=1 Tax=Xylophilus sp. GOD-11R TaxID=3089814 RepID=UPI00298CDEFA|nr:hypothetical protein [Xylophilus sp. GOD-11R]WPB56634.1 hypothetical protein R9X41_21235 [Xylophilus sp. GOD-11R]
MIDLDLCSETLAIIANLNGISRDQLDREESVEGENFLWKNNYKISLQKNVTTNISYLISAFKLANDAIDNGDKLTAMMGLALAHSEAKRLENIFAGIQEDSLRMLKIDGRFNWPPIPEKYEIPEKYNFQGRR